MLEKFLLDPMEHEKRVSELEHRVETLEKVVEELTEKDRQLDLTKSEVLDF